MLTLAVVSSAGGIRTSAPVDGRTAAEASSDMEAESIVSAGGETPVVAVGVSSEHGDSGTRQTLQIPEPRTSNVNAMAIGEVETTATVEELLEDGLRLVGASPVHLAVRGTAGADTVRCAWRGTARTAAQREHAIRFLLKLNATDTIPSAAHLEVLFAATLMCWIPNTERRRRPTS